MPRRPSTNRAAVVAAAVTVLAAGYPATRVQAARAPQDAAQRMAATLEAAAEDYREAVRDGSVVRPAELEQATAFVEEAQHRMAALHLEAATTDELQTLLAEAHAAIASTAPPERVAETLAAARQRVLAATGASTQTYPVAAPSAARGQQLFADNCVTCHGERGDGKGSNAAQLRPPPANFTDPAFMRGETPYDFFQVISLGKHNTAMPAWDGVLSVQDRWDLIAYLWTLAPGPARIAEGQGIYLTRCASCHGTAADGQAVFSPALLKPAGDLSRPDALAKRTDAELFAATTDGIAGSPMPAFASSVSADDRWKAVAFLRTLSLGGTLPAAGAPGAGPDLDGKRFAGLLRLLGREYATAWSGTELTNTLAYDAAAALAEQAQRLGDALAHRDEPVAPDRAHQTRDAVAALVAAVNDRAPLPRVAAAVDALAARADAWETPATPAAPAAADDIGAALAESLRLIEGALAAYDRGDTAAAGGIADAYLEFEPVEQRLGATAPALKTRVEDHFMQLRQALKIPNNGTAARAAVDTIRADFADVRAALQPRTGPYALFLESATIILREGFEMVLIIGALLAYVVKSGHTAMRRPIQVGTALGVAASLVTAAIMGELLRAYPSSSDLLEGATMLLAAVVLFWVSYWLVSKAEADRWQRYIRETVQRALSSRRTVALAGAAFLAVYREGFETVLFYQALYASAAGQSATVTAGFLAGTVALAGVYLAFRRLHVRIPIQQFFFVTGLLLYVMAAVFAGQGVNELQHAGVIGVTPVSGVPAISFLGIFPSLESLGTQAVFVALLLYATTVTLRRRRRASANASESGAILAEIQAVRHAIDGVQSELAMLRAAGALGTGAIEQRMTGVLQQVERLATHAGGAPATPVPNAPRQRQ
jgi:high-affinity iron transporter